MPPSQHPKHWVLTLNQIHSPTGTLQLGQVLTDPYDPTSALISTTAALHAPPAGALRDRGEARDVELRTSSVVSRAFKAWLRKNISLSGTGADDMAVEAEAESERRYEDAWDWTLQKLRWDAWTPDRRYAERVFSSGDVPFKTQWWKARRRLYVVSGVRVAEAGRLESTERTEKKAGAGGRLETRAGTVADGSAGAQGERQETETVEMKQSTEGEFVFAYQLHEITWRLWPSVRPTDVGEIHDLDSSKKSRQGQGHGGVKDDQMQPMFTGIKGIAFDANQVDPQQASNISLLVE